MELPGSKTDFVSAADLQLEISARLAHRKAMHYLRVRTGWLCTNKRRRAISAFSATS